ncbi:hypothetical protein C2857_001859 [Epichloe festucae Fl1]|uniref:DUF7598 domain-containing protein n=1 Tax=Epichloe festucae (strain Fl1) TaxID=877507 RepID=A0A7S9KKE5_EPIFF|nr:hypothetical protein C2857_001859 [Epichloe festucae Fl1]
MIWMILLKLFKPAAIKGAGMVILQTLRVFSIITLLAISASCWVLIIKVNKDRAYFVFECASLVFTSIMSLFLLLSELPVKAIQKYYRRTWPVLSDFHGHSWIGLAMVMIGCSILGNLNKPANDDADNLDPHFSKLVLASAILSLTFGLLYIIGSLIWRDGNEGINSRDIRDHGSLAKNGRGTLPDYSSSTGSHSYSNEKKTSKLYTALWGKAKKETGENKSNRPTISGPFPAHQDIERDAGHDDRRSPIVPGVKRPDTALHPMNHSFARSSRYSEAAHLSRF